MEEPCRTAAGSRSLPAAVRREDPRCGLLHESELSALHLVEEDERLLQLAFWREGHVAHDAAEITLRDLADERLTGRRRGHLLHRFDDDRGLHVAVGRVGARLLLERFLVGA